MLLLLLFHFIRFFLPPDWFGLRLCASLKTKEMLKLRFGDHAVTIAVIIQLLKDFVQSVVLLLLLRRLD